MMEIWRALEVPEELVTRPEVSEVLGPGAGAGEGVAMGFPPGGELTLGPWACEELLGRGATLGVGDASEAWRGMVVELGVTVVPVLGAFVSAVGAAPVFEPLASESSEEEDGVRLSLLKKSLTLAANLPPSFSVAPLSDELDLSSVEWTEGRRRFEKEGDLRRGDDAGGGDNDRTILGGVGGGMGDDMVRRG